MAIYVYINSFLEKVVTIKVCNMQRLVRIRRWFTYTQLGACIVCQQETVKTIMGRLVYGLKGRRTHVQYGFCN